MDVADWLRKLGLEQYEPAFRENEIDERVLPSLTAEDLRDLGITLVGHRRRLLDAIAALGSPFPNPPPLTGEGRVGAQAERRQLTVMFCDLVGSTALAARLDPEICATSSPRINALSPGSSPALMGSSPSTWATVSWPISAILERTRTTPSGRSGRGWG
jgi:hypothetical protein